MKKTPRRKKSKPPERKYAGAIVWAPFHTNTLFSLLGVGDVAYLTSECLGQSVRPMVKGVVKGDLRPKFRCPFRAAGNYFLKRIPT